MSTSPLEASKLQFDLVDRLHKSLRVAGKSAVQIAADLDTHRNTVGNYLSGRTNPDRSSLARWSLATGVPLSWLESGETPPSPGPGTESHHPKASIGAIRAGIKDVLGLDIDMLTFATLVDAMSNGRRAELDRAGFPAWVLAAASGYEPEECGVSPTAVPAYIDPKRLIQDLRAAVAEHENAPQPDNGPGGVSAGLLPRLDSNQQPSG